MAAPAVQGTPTTNFSSSSFSSITVDKPTGTTVGETLVIYVKLQSTGAAPTSVSVPGFTPRQDSGTSGVRTRVFVLDREVTGAEGATFTATPGSNPNRQIAIVCFRLAAANGVEFDTSIGGGVQGNASAFSMPELTTGHNDCFVGAFAGAYVGPIDPALSGYSSVANIDALDYVWGKTQASAGSAGTPTISAGSSNERMGVVVASWNEKAGGGGSDVTGSGSSTITVSSTASGVRGVTGTAASTITATATASGTVGHTGAADSTITASATASGDVAHTGAASSTITASSTGSGVRGVTGAGSSTITASGTAAGDSTSPRSGAGSSTITASATASGVRGVTGAGSSTITATATATDGAEPPSGAGSSTIAASATASGVVGHAGTAASTVTVAATATGVRGVLGAGASTITATATIVIDVPDVPDERTITVAAENRTITVAAESRVIAVTAEARTVTAGA